MPRAFAEPIGKKGTEMAHDEDPVDELRSVGMTSAAAVSRVAETLIRSAQDQKMRATQAAQAEAEDAARRYEAQAAIAEQYYQQTNRPGWITTATGDEVARAWKGAQQWRELDPERFGPYADQLNARFMENYQVNLRGVADLTGSLDAAEELARETVGIVRGGADQERTQEDRDREQAERERKTSELETHEAGQESDPDSAGEHDRSAADAAGRSDAAEVAADRHGEAALDLDVEADVYDSAERRSQTNEEMEKAGVPRDARDAKMTADHLNGQHPEAAARSGQMRQPKAAKGRGVEQARKRTKSMGRGR
jgi:hypothetical protein